MLTGKAKKQFEEWMRPNRLEHGRYGQLLNNTFNDMPLSFQWGVYLEWADSLGYRVEVWFYNGLGEYDNHWNANIFIGEGRNEKELEYSDFNSRKEAQTEAIKKLNELINQE